MNRLISVTAFALIVTAGSAFTPFGAMRAPKTVTITVHCPDGNQAAFVSPEVVRIVVGDTVEWAMAGPVVSDSIIITLKDVRRAWPFGGNRSRGGARFKSGNAHTRGTYSYNARMRCRMPDGSVRRVVVDPDIIIE